MVVSDTIDNNITIEGNTVYTLTIGKNLRATDGTTLGADQTIKFKTLDQKKINKSLHYHDGINDGWYDILHNKEC